VHLYYWLKFVENHRSVYIYVQVVVACVS